MSLYSSKECLQLQLEKTKCTGERTSFDHMSEDHKHNTITVKVVIISGGKIWDVQKVIMMIYQDHYESGSARNHTNEKI